MKKMYLYIILFFINISFLTPVVISNRETNRSPIFQISEEQLRDIARTIAGRQQDLDRLRKKLTHHSSRTYNIWKTYHRLGDLPQDLSRKYKKQLVDWGVVNENVAKNVLRSGRGSRGFAYFTYSVEQNFQHYLMLAIENGQVTQDKNTNKRSRGIRITHVTNAPIGFEGYKTQDPKTGKMSSKEIPVSRYYVSFDIEDILSKLERGQNYDKKRDGRLTTMTPDSGIKY